MNNGGTAGSSTAQFNDDEIEAVINHYDDPSHPDAVTVAGARAQLSEIQTTIERRWDEWLESIREGEITVTAETGDLFVFHDSERQVWNRLLDGIEQYDGVARTILRIVHHQAGTRLLDRSFEGSDAIVVRKPQDASAGQRFVESVIASLTARGLTAGEAWSYYGIEIRGLTADEWLEYGPYDGKIELSDTVERARDKLGE